MPAGSRTGTSRREGATRRPHCNFAFFPSAEPLGGSLRFPLLWEAMGRGGGDPRGWIAAQTAASGAVLVESSWIPVQEWV